MVDELSSFWKQPQMPKDLLQGPSFPSFFFLNTSIYFSVLLTELRGIRESLLRVVRVELWNKRGRVGQRLPLFFLSLKRKGLQLAVKLCRHL